MKYTIEIDIEKPIDKTIELFDNEDNLKEWMIGLESFEHISGEKGQPGAKSKIVFQNGKRRTEMIETITVRNLPEEFSAKYEANGVLNIQKNSFIKIGENTTRWVSNAEFISSNFMMKLMMFLMPGAFKKQSMKFAESFKKFAESST